jgi:methyl-accepting chemotaxis protein
MAKRHKQRKLKNYMFVNKAQVIIGISNLIIFLLMAGLMIFAVLSPLYSSIFQSGDVHLQNISSKIFLMLLERLAIVFTILFVILFLNQSLVVHRICGPLVSFKLTLDKIGAGNFTRKINLRRRDLFQQEAAQINELLDNLSAMLSNLRGYHQTIAASLDKVPKETEQKAELQNILNNIAAQNQAASDALSNMKVIEPDEKEEKNTRFRFPH